MFFSFLYFSTGLLGLLIMFIINIKYRSLSGVNIFLQIPIIINSVRFILNGINILNNSQSITNFIYLFDLLAAMTIPCFYLYLVDLISINRNKRTSYYVYFIPSLIFFLAVIIQTLSKIEFNYISKIAYMAFIIGYGTFYNVKCYQFLKKNVWNKKVELKSLELHEKTISNWTLFLLICTTLLLLRIIVFFIATILIKGTFPSALFLWIGALAWFILYLKLLLTPEILYGNQLLTKKIENYHAPKFVMDIIWSMTSIQEITNLKDQKLSEIINPLLIKYLRKIEEAALTNNFFRNTDDSIEHLSKELKIPKYHLSYLFKYHCKENYTDFKKIVRIQDAINLLKNDYLSSHTFDSLATEVGFTSYTSFFLSFKEITGLAPQEYLGKL
jgi:AraC-like DNA-binding protein